MFKLRYLYNKTSKHSGPLYLNLGDQTTPAIARFINILQISDKKNHIQRTRYFYKNQMRNLYGPQKHLPKQICPLL